MNKSVWDEIVGFLAKIHQTAEASGVEHEAISQIKGLAQKGLDALETTVEAGLEKFDATGH